jgi:hypothetical protein
MSATSIIPPSAGTQKKVQEEAAPPKAKMRDEDLSKPTATTQMKAAFTSQTLFRLGGHLSP